MGCGQFCCFPSPGYIIGRGPPGGPAAYGASGVGYGHGSRSVPIPVPASSQVLVASHQVAMVSSQMPAAIPITTVPSTNVYVPSYGQASVMNPPYAASIVQPVAGNIVAPVQPYGISSIAP